ncbi:MAG: uncharacterized protein QG629_904 [Patescibacteria group bacterium]|nr:DUF192 domain-containing protein [Candidatus Saccharibacteria bacterium]MDQ5963821.1 uncharacterized protein [Patescibacteria group bacterium]
MQKKALLAGGLCLLGVLCITLVFTLSQPLQDTQTHGRGPQAALSTAARAKIGGSTFDLAVARTAQAHVSGLSNRDSLPPNQGMIFVGLDPEEMGIWMKDMRFDIDVLWVNEKNTVVYIAPSVSRESYPAVFRNPPDVPAKYVIELASGQTEKSAIHIGSTVRFSGESPL